MNGNTRRKKYDDVAKRDGEYCRGCGVLSSERQLVLDHKDNNPKNNVNSNLQILCRQCNYFKNPRRPVDLCECESEAPDQSELEINRLKEPAFRKFVYHQLNEHGTTPEKDLINSGAEVLKMSPVTCKRYLDKMCSSTGTLRRLKQVRTIVVCFKKDLDLI
jgi:hypothetical protein